MKTDNDYREIIEKLYAGIIKYPANIGHRTIPKIFGKSYHENFISKYLAHILDPVANGIGLQPLQEILQPFFDTKGISLNFENVNIETEHHFKDNHKRIDILIEIDECIVIGIENKINAKEHIEQTILYRKSIEKYYLNWQRIGIFLTRTGEEPQDKELFESMSYGELLSRLERVQYDFTEDAHGGVLFIDFKNHIRDYLQENSLKENLSKRDLFFLSKDKIKEFSEVKLAYKNSRENVLEFIKFQAENHELFKEGVWEFNFKPSWQQMYKKNWVGVHFEFHFTDDHLINGDFPLTVDVERNDNGLFLKHFDELHNKKPGKWKNGIDYKSTRMNAIAYKIYKIDFEDENKIEGNLVKVIDDSLGEFSFMVDLIDETFEQIEKQS